MYFARILPPKIPIICLQNCNITGLIKTTDLLHTYQGTTIYCVVRSHCIIVKPNCSTVIHILADCVHIHVIKAEVSCILHINGALICSKITGVKLTCYSNVTTSPINSWLMTTRFVYGGASFNALQTFSTKNNKTLWMQEKRNNKENCGGRCQEVHTPIQQVAVCLCGQLYSQCSSSRRRKSTTERERLITGEFIQMYSILCIFAFVPF